MGSHVCEGGKEMVGGGYKIQEGMKRKKGMRENGRFKLSVMHSCEQGTRVFPGGWVSRMAFTFFFLLVA